MKYLEMLREKLQGYKSYLVAIYMLGTISAYVLGLIDWATVVNTGLVCASLFGITLSAKLNRNL